MKITPEELTNHGYVLLDHLGHKELIPFVRTYLKKGPQFPFFTRSVMQQSLESSFSGFGKVTVPKVSI